MKRTVPILGLVFAACLALTSCGLGGTTATDTTATAQVPNSAPTRRSRSSSSPTTTVS